MEWASSVTHQLCYVVFICWGHNLRTWLLIHLPSKRIFQSLTCKISDVVCFCVAQVGRPQLICGVELPSLAGALKSDRRLFLQSQGCKSNMPGLQKKNLKHSCAELLVLQKGCIRRSFAVIFNVQCDQRIPEPAI